MPEPSAPPPAVHVAIVAGADSASSLLSRVSSWFERDVARCTGSLERTLEAGSIFAPYEQPGLRIWIWLRGPTSARLFFAVAPRSGDTPRYLVSDVALERGLDELGMEQLGQVVYSSAMALWAGDLESTRGEVEAGLAPLTPPPPPAQAPAPSPEPSAPARSSSGARLHARLAAEYALRLRGDEGAAQIVSAAAGVVSTKPESELALLLHAGVFVPRSTSVQGIELRLTGATFALGVDGALRVAERLWLAAELAPGIDVIRFQPSTAQTDLRAATAALDARPNITSALSVRIERAGLYFGLRAFTVFQLVHTHYDLASAGARSRVLTPWPIQPGLALQIAW